METKLSKGTTTMQLVELLTVGLLTSPLNESHRGRVLKSRFARLLKLDYQDWMTQLKADGFTDTHMEAMESFLQESFNEAELAESLAYLIQGVVDPTDESEINEAMAHWTRSADWNNLWETVCAQKFPAPLDAAAYAGRHILSIASSTLALDMTCIKAPANTDCDWNFTEAEIKEGIELAEIGLTDGSAEWPPY